MKQGPLKLFLKLTALLSDNNIDKEWGGKYETAMVPLLLILFAAAVTE